MKEILMQKPKETVLEFVQQLIEEGNRLLESKFRVAPSSFATGEFVPVQPYAKWGGSCRLLVKQLGSFSEPWESVLTEVEALNSTAKVEVMLGALESIEENVQKGRLEDFEEIVFAEAYANLIDQGGNLIKKKHFSAAAVLFRAVLEERLRRLCEVNNKLPAKKRPSLEDYIKALSKAGILDKIVKKQVEKMAATGSVAVEMYDEIKREKAEKLHSDLVSFLARFSGSQAGEEE